MKLNVKRIQNYVIPLFSIFLIGVIFYSGYKIWEILYVSDDAETPTHYVNKIEDDYVIPTVAESKTIIKPYTSDEVTVSIPYYKTDGSDEEQQSALIYYENIYMQNTGIMYSSANAFDVFAVLDGTVKEVKEDAIMGKIVEIEHSKNLTTIYQSLTDIKVNKGETIKQGELIGTSAQNSIVKDNQYALHFEVYKNGELMNPEEFYNLSLDTLNE